MLCAVESLGKKFATSVSNILVAEMKNESDVDVVANPVNTARSTRLLELDRAFEL